MISMNNLIVGSAKMEMAVTDIPGNITPKDFSKLMELSFNNDERRLIAKYNKLQVLIKENPSKYMASGSWQEVVDYIKMELSWSYNIIRSDFEE